MRTSRRSRDNLDLTPQSRFSNPMIHSGVASSGQRNPGHFCRSADAHHLGFMCLSLEYPKREAPRRTLEHVSKYASQSLNPTIPVGTSCLPPALWDAASLHIGVLTLLNQCTNPRTLEISALRSRISSWVSRKMLYPSITFLVRLRAFELGDPSGSVTPTRKKMNQTLSVQH